MLYSAYKLNKQGDNIQPWHTPFSYLEPVCCSMSSSNCCVLTCIQFSQEAGQVVWYSHLFQNCPQFIVIYFVSVIEAGFQVESRSLDCKVSLEPWRTKVIKPVYQITFQEGNSAMCLASSLCHGYSKKSLYPQISILKFVPLCSNAFQDQLTLFIAKLYMCKVLWHSNPHNNPVTYILLPSPFFYGDVKLTCPPLHSECQSWKLRLHRMVPKFLYTASFLMILNL